MFAVIREKQDNACEQQKCIEFELCGEKNSLLFSPHNLNLQAYSLTKCRLSLSNRSQRRALSWRTGQLHCVSKNFGDGGVSLLQDKTHQEFLVYFGFKLLTARFNDNKFPWQASKNELSDETHSFKTFSFENVGTWAEVEWNQTFRLPSYLTRFSGILPETTRP